MVPTIRGGRSVQIAQGEAGKGGEKSQKGVADRGPSVGFRTLTTGRKAASFRRKRKLKKTGEWKKEISAQRLCSTFRRFDVRGRGDPL